MSTWVSQYQNVNASIQILLELRITEVVATTTAIRCAKLQLNHHRQQTNTQFFTSRMPFQSSNQQCQSIEEKVSHFMDLLAQSSSSNLVLDH